MSNFRVIHFKTDKGVLGIDYLDNEFGHRNYGYRVYMPEREETDFVIQKTEKEAQDQMMDIKEGMIQRRKNIKEIF